MSAIAATAWASSRTRWRQYQQETAALRVSRKGDAGWRFLSGEGASRWLQDAHRFPSGWVQQPRGWSRLPMEVFGGSRTRSAWAPCPGPAVPRVFGQRGHVDVLFLASTKATTPAAIAGEHPHAFDHRQVTRAPAQPRPRAMLPPEMMMLLLRSQMTSPSGASPASRPCQEQADAVDIIRSLFVAVVASVTSFPATAVIVCTSPHVPPCSSRTRSRTAIVARLAGAAAWPAHCSESSHSSCHYVDHQRRRFWVRSCPWRRRSPCPSGPAGWPTASATVPACASCSGPGRGLRRDHGQHVGAALK